MDSEEGKQIIKILGKKLDSEENQENIEEDDSWKYLPDILLEDILSLLTPKHRHEASQVCRHWYETFYAPRVWETFILRATTLTRKRYNMFKGYQRELCPRKAQDCFGKVGCLFRRVVVTPIEDFYNLHEFLRILGAFLVFFDEFPMPNLHTFNFTFACESYGINGNMVHGTGGQILHELNSVLRSLRHLKNLKVNQVLLDHLDVPTMIGAALQSCAESLQSLEIVNCTRTPYPLLEVARFENLQRLVTSPQHLDDEVVLLLASAGLSSLTIVQDKYTCPCDPVSSEAWKMAREIAPFFSVTLEVVGKGKDKLLIQPHAPVRSIVFRTPFLKLSHQLATDIVHYYGRTLTSFKQLVLPRVFGSRSFHERGDTAFVMLVRNCPSLSTLVINERISTATLLVIAHEQTCLKHFYVRQNALITKCDWPKQAQWSNEFYQKLRQCAHSYQNMTQDVSQIFNRKWSPLTDWQFKVMFHTCPF